MSLLYKDESDVTVNMSVTNVSGLNAGKPYFKFEFSSDCGKFGTEEQLASFEFTPEELLKMFSKIEL